MPAAYTGNPAGGSLTSPAPGRTTVPAANLPADDDPDNAATFLTGYETVLDWLAYMQLNGSLGDALGGGATSFDGSSNPTTWNDMLTVDGAPISGLDVLPTFAAASGFSVTIGAGAGYLNTAVGITPGESTYRSIHWASQNVTHAAPDGTNGRIDAVTVTPAAFGSPSTLAVVTGTPAAAPLAPAVPAGAGVLFYVYVPATAPDATSFRACRGLWRRVGYPWAGMSGIISGLELSWFYSTDPTLIEGSYQVGDPQDGSGTPSAHRMLIDGEPVEWTGIMVPVFGGVRDTTADPFSTAAPSGNDRPYYFYAVGGRHNPMPSVGYPNALTGAGTYLNPVTIVESTVPPNVRTGKPTGNLTVHGLTVTPDGAVYIGLGFVAAGTSRRRPCVMDAEMTCALNPLQVIQHTFTTTAAEDIGTFAGGAQPSISTKMRVSAVFGAPTAAMGSAFIRVQNFPAAAFPGGLVAGVVLNAPAAGNSVVNDAAIHFAARIGSELWAVLSSGSIAGNSLLVAAMGFNHRVNRICTGF